MPGLSCVVGLSMSAWRILKQRSSNCLSSRSAHAVMVTHAQERWQGFHL